MPIVVICSSCKAKLNAPDKLAGKKVKCPKCQTPILVAWSPDDEDTEVMHEPAPAETPKPAPRPKPPAAKPPARKPAPRDTDEDDAPPPKSKAPLYEDDNEEEEKPKKKKPAKKKSALPIILIGGGAALFLGVIIVAVLILLFWPWGGPDPAKPPVAGQTKPNQPPPVNWVLHDDKEFFFRAAFPNAQPAHADPLAALGNAGQAELMGGVLKGGKGRSLSAADAGRKYELIAFALPVAGVPGQALLAGMKDLLGSMFKGFTIEPRAELPAGGHPGQDFTLRQGDKDKLVRVVIAPGIIYLVAIEGGQDLTPDDALAKEYFNRFVSTLPPDGGAGTPMLPKDLIP